MNTKDLPLLVALLGVVGATLLCSGDGIDNTARAIQGGALLIASTLIWLGWFIGHRLMLGVAGLSEIVRLMEEARKEKSAE